MGENGLVQETEYPYVDIHGISKSGVRHKWQRIKAADLEHYRMQMVELEYQHSFSTIQHFILPEHEENEPYICPLYFDLDSDKDLQEALDDARKIWDYYVQGHNAEEGVKFFFSGNRGIHIEVCYEYYNARPSNRLVKIWRQVAESMATLLTLKTFDRSVYSKRRMWRLTNTRHGKSGLWKIPLLPHELTMSVKDIKELAEGPREVEDV